REDRGPRPQRLGEVEPAEDYGGGRSRLSRGGEAGEGGEDRLSAAGAEARSGERCPGERGGGGRRDEGAPRRVQRGQRKVRRADVGRCDDGADREAGEAAGEDR